MPDGDLDHLALALGDAGVERDVDVDVLADMSPDELDYLSRVGELEDPVTDGIENESCV